MGNIYGSQVFVEVDTMDRLQRLLGHSVPMKEKLILMQIKTFTKLGLGLAAAAAFITPAHAGEYPDISRAELMKQISAKKVTVIDVNGTESWKSGRIPGALNYDSVKGKLATALPKNKNALVVAYCGNEYCGAYKKAAAEAKKLGYTNVKHFSGGIAGWKKSGAPIQKS